VNRWFGIAATESSSGKETPVPQVANGQGVDVVVVPSGGLPVVRRQPCYSRGMNGADVYRKQAEDARQMAEKAISPLDKATWLRLAEDWQRLAESVDGRGKR
jgi:hypothetical protein